MIRTCIDRRIINNDILLLTAPLISSLGGFCLLNYFRCSSTKEAQLWQWGFQRIISIYCCRSAHYAREKGEKKPKKQMCEPSPVISPEKEFVFPSGCSHEKKDNRQLSKAWADDWFINVALTQPVFSPRPLSRSLWSPRCDCRCSPWPCMKSPSHSCKPHQRRRQMGDERKSSLSSNWMQMRHWLDCGEAADQLMSEKKGAFHVSPEACLLNVHILWFLSCTLVLFHQDLCLFKYN